MDTSLPPGTPVRFISTARPELAEARGVIGSSTTATETIAGICRPGPRPPRLHVHLLSPPSAAAAFAAGVFVARDMLEPTGPPDPSLLPPASASPPDSGFDSMGLLLEMLGGAPAPGGKTLLDELRSNPAAKAEVEARTPATRCRAPTRELTES